MTGKISSAYGIYLTGIRDGELEKAFSENMGEYYIQHSTGVKDKKEGFMEFFNDFKKRYPQRDIKIIRAIEDGQYVFLHVIQFLNNKTSNWVTADLFDTDENDKIIEHWDVISEYIEQEKTVSKNDMVLGEFQIIDEEKTEENKKLARTFLFDIFEMGNYDNLNKYIDENKYIEHNPKMEDGTDSLKKFIIKEKIKYDFVFKVIGQGNYVVAYSQVIFRNEKYCVFDIYRIENNKIVEHWDNIEIIPKHEDLVNVGKF